MLNRREADTWVHQLPSGRMLVEGSIFRGKLRMFPQFLLRSLADTLEFYEPLGSEREVRCAREAARLLEEDITHMADAMEGPQGALRATGRHRSAFRSPVRSAC